MSVTVFHATAVVFLLFNGAATLLSAYRRHASKRTVTERRTTIAETGELSHIGYSNSTPLPADDASPIAPPISLLDRLDEEDWRQSSAESRDDAEQAGTRTHRVQSNLSPVRIMLRLVAQQRRNIRQTVFIITRENGPRISPLQ